MKVLKKIFTMQALLVLLLSPFGGIAQNNVCFEIEPNPNPSDPALSGFTKYINVFGVGIYAESTISDEKVKHVAAICAEWLDNNEDSIVDNSDVLYELTSRDALIPVFSYEGSPAEETFFDNYNGNGVGAACYNNEIIPERPLVNQFDATIEEVLHTISSIGYANAFPNAFGEGESSNSLLTQAMDSARGGHFVIIPNPYPSEAWYHYDDYTCEYNCMATEYFYWGLTSKLGIQDYGNRCNEIVIEWEACTATQFQTMDTLLFNLFSNPIYNIPTNAPDGNYCPLTSVIDMVTPASIVKVFPSPANNQLTIQMDKQFSGPIPFVITGISGRVLMKDSIYSTNHIVNLENISTGVYFLKIQGSNPVKFIVE